MKTFIKDTEKMTERELRLELIVTRRIIDDIYELTEGKNVTSAQNIINQVAHDCRRELRR